MTEGGGVTVVALLLRRLGGAVAGAAGLLGRRWLPRAERDRHHRRRARNQNVAGVMIGNIRLGLPPAPAVGAGGAVGAVAVVAA